MSNVSFSRPAVEQMIRGSYEADNAAETRLVSGDQPRKFPEGIHNLLLALSDVYSVFPDLWQNPALRYKIRC